MLSLRAVRPRPPQPSLPRGADFVVEFSFFYVELLYGLVELPESIRLQELLVHLFDLLDYLVVHLVHLLLA